MMEEGTYLRPMTVQSTGSSSIKRKVYRTCNDARADIFNHIEFFL